jgi:hypothetical protein
MNEHDGESSDLDEHALAMIAAYRQEEALPPAVRDRVWDRMQGDVGAAPASATVKWGVALAAAAAVIAVVAIGARSLIASEEKAGAQQAPYGHETDPDAGVAEHVDERMHVERSPMSRGDAIGPADLESAGPADLENAGPADLENAGPADLENAGSVDREKAGSGDVDARGSVDAASDRRDGSVTDGAVDAREQRPDRVAKPRARRAPRDAARTPVDPEPEVAPVDTLAEETRMLARAREALGAGRPNAALSILAEHRRTFPSGRLAPERAALRVIALCDAGRRAEGARAADAFLAAHSAHALATRVRKACER